MKPDAAPVRRRVTWLIGAFVVALLALTAVGVARVRRGMLARSHPPSADEATRSGASVDEPAGTDDVADLLRRARGNPGLLIDAFAAWAGDPQAQAKRRVVLGALAAEPQAMVRLAELLAAVEASPIPLDTDPLRRDVVAAVSSVWTGALVRKGRDLMFAEAHPRSRQVVIASFVELALSDRGAALDATQRSGLTSDFIDLYRQAGPDQRRDIVAVVRQLGGNDTAELLQGNGLGNDSTLERHVQYRRNLEAATRAAAASAH